MGCVKRAQWLTAWSRFRLWRRKRIGTYRALAYLLAEEVPLDVVGAIEYAMKAERPTHRTRCRTGRLQPTYLAGF